MDSHQQGIFNYLTTFIGNLNKNELAAFLRFVTGCSSLLAKPINVSFKHLVEANDVQLAIHAAVICNCPRVTQHTLSLLMSFATF